MQTNSTSIKQQIKDVISHTDNAAVKDVMRNTLNFIKKSDAPTSDI